LVLLGTAFLVFVVALMGSRTARLGGSGPIRRPVLDTVLGVVAGAALGSPLLLPGMQLLSGSVRSGKNLSQAVSAQSIMLTLFQGFDGLPVTGSRFFGSGYYTKSVAYVGVIAIVLAVLAVVAAVKLRQRRAEVIGFGAVAIVMAAIVYLPIVESALDGLPLIGSVLWRRATIPLMFGLAVLAGMGTDVLVRSHPGDAVRRWMAVVFGAAAVVLLLLWGFDRGHLRSMEASIRARSFIWPFAVTALGLAVAACFALGARRRGTGPVHAGGVGAGRWAAALFLVCETVFLVTAGTPLWTSQPAYLAPTPNEATLARAVGSSVVGLGANTCFGSDQLGIVPNYNVALGIKEFAIYEPLIPRTYGESWLAATGQPSAPVQFPGVPFSVFCPAVTSASIARRYGVGFVLESAGQRGPAGAVFDRDVGDERLYRIPGSGLATLSAAPTDANLPGPDAAGTVVPVTQPDPSTWTIKTEGTVSQVLRLRLTDVPGWHATIDGRPLVLQRFDGVMLQARIPAGRHVVKVWYWPRAFTEGLVLAVLGAVALCGALVTEWLRRRRRAAVPASPAPPTPVGAAP
jgi:hypothetical protein